MKKKVIISIFGILAAVIIIAIIATVYLTPQSPWKVTEDRPLKVFMAHSYYPEYSSIVETVKGFTEYFESQGIDVEIKQYAMGWERDYSPENRKKESQLAIAEADAWGPDIVFTTDDYAQEDFTQHYLNTDMPIVFAGVNKGPEDYGFEDANNIAGVMEREHLSETIETLRIFVPYVRKIAVISGPLELWAKVKERLYQEYLQNPDIEIVGWHAPTYFSEYKDLVIDYQDKIDAIFILGINLLQYDNGTILAKGEGVKWTSENSNIPEIGLSSSFAKQGGLVEMSTDSYAHGKLGAQIVREILVDGKSPKEIGFISLGRGYRKVNMARAESLGITKEDLPQKFLDKAELIEETP